MDPHKTGANPPDTPAVPSVFGMLIHELAIALTAFLTLVDLFATQAILPSLARAYNVAPAAMGLAVNATTMGMAVSSLAVAFLSQRIDRRQGIFLSLTLLAIPTALLAFAPNLAVFTALRICQGVFMASAFTLMLAYLGEHHSPREAGAAFAAYITGNVASNLIGRLMSAAVADHFGLVSNFIAFALLNLAGGALVWFTIERAGPMGPVKAQARSPWSAVRAHASNPPLAAAFGIGFCILFAFIGTFTYVNFVLVRAPLALGAMSLGFVYFVFLPSMFTTPVAGATSLRFGVRPTIWAALALALVGLPLLVAPDLTAVLVGLTLVGVGTFFAQAAATGFVGRTATQDRGAASGMYLASYFLGGLAGSAALGQIFDQFGWEACVIGIAASLLLAAVLTLRLS